MLHRRLSLSKLTWNPQKWGGDERQVPFKNIVILGFHLKLQGLDIIGPMVVNPSSSKPVPGWLKTKLLAAVPSQKHWQMDAD